MLSYIVWSTFTTVKSLQKNIASKLVHCTVNVWKVLWVGWTESYLLQLTFSRENKELVVTGIYTSYNRFIVWISKGYEVFESI